jgi:hypothetical protein
LGNELELGDGDDVGSGDEEVQLAEVLAVLEDGFRLLGGIKGRVDLLNQVDCERSVDWRFLLWALGFYVGLFEELGVEAELCAQGFQDLN